MRLCRKIPCAAALLALVLAPATGPARADLLDVLAGDTIDTSLQTIDAMLLGHGDKLDTRVNGYITRLEDLQMKAMADVDDLREQVKDDILELREVIVDDIRRTLWEGECTAERLMNDSMQDAVRSLLDQITTDFPTIKLRFFGVTFLSLSTSKNPNSVPLPDHDVLYYEFRDSTLKTVEAYYEAEGPTARAYPAYSSLLKISVMARRTACFYTGDETTVARFIEQHYRFAAQASLWNTVVNVQYSN